MNLQWTTEVPKKSAYYWAIPKDKDSWLDGSIEVVYLYYNGKWMILRPGETKAESVNNFIYWPEPLHAPPLPKEWENESE